MHTALKNRVLDRCFKINERRKSFEPDDLESIQAMTIAATPKNKGFVNCYQKGGRLGAQAACLIRWYDESSRRRRHI